MLELTINQSQHLLPWQVNLVSIYKWASKPDYNNGTDQPSYPRSMNRAFVIRSLASTLDKPATYKISIV